VPLFAMSAELRSAQSRLTIAAPMFHWYFSTTRKVMSSVCGMPKVNSSMAFKNFCWSASTS